MGNTVMSNAERQKRLRERRKAVKSKLDAKAKGKRWRRIDVIAYVKLSDNPFAEGGSSVILFTVDGKRIGEYELANGL